MQWKGRFERELEQGLQKGSDPAGQTTSSPYCLLMLDCAEEETIRGCDKRTQLVQRGKQEPGEYRGTHDS